MPVQPRFAFEHSYIDTTLEGRSYGQTALADLDGDGRLEFVTGRSGGDVYWYDYHAPGRWTRHLLGTASPSDVGGAALDVDGDGWIDFVTGGAWYRNPAPPRNTPFERIVFDAALRGVHDLAVGDIDGDGRPEVVTLSDKTNLRWYRIPTDPRQSWEKHDIGPAVHAGLALGDIDGDGDLDVVRTDVWFENVKGDGTEWVSHPIGPNTPPPPDFRPPFAFNATKAVVCDMNRDGRNDIVLVDAEIPGGKVWWMENLDGRGTHWRRHEIPNGDPARRGAYHSLWVGDLDGDGDLDVFSCEMEGVPGDNPPRWYVWENLDGKGGTWQEHVILDARLGGHEAVVGDVDGDGRPDICSKLWSPRQDNANAGRMHVDFLRNVGVAAVTARSGAARTTCVPGREWQDATPESQGVDGATLREALDLLARTVGADGARELVIVRHGRLIWKGEACDRRHGVWSMTKSFTSTVLGLLIADGKCTLDTRAAEVLPDLRAHYPEVTLRHLATMTSGYRAVGDEPAGTYRHGPSRTPFVPNPEPLFVPPGSQYAYWDSAMNLCALVLTRIAGEPLEELFRRRVAQPIDLADWDWGDYATVDGVVVNGGSGNADRHVVISAREMARFGLLFLNRGRWNDRQVIPESWIAEATRVHVPATLPWAQPESEIDGRGAYGLNWWCNGLGADGRRKFPGAPAGMFWASGHNNNRCFVIPEWDMVIVRLGLDGKARDGVWNAFLAKVGEAIRGRAPVAGGSAKAADGGRGGPTDITPPYPPSPVIERVEFDFATHRRLAEGSDNWPTTWADDGHLYSAWGDGGGFGGSNSRGRASLGVARIEGGAAGYTGHNVWGGFEAEHPATFDGKSYGTLSVGGVLYMWVAHQPNPHLARCQLATSRDHGATWQLADWSFGYADQLTVPTFASYGRDYAGARDGYVYSYFIHPTWGPGKSETGNYGFDVHRPGRVYLARVPQAAILDRGRYEFCAGVAGDGTPRWSPQASDKRPVFEDPNGVGWNLSVSYNPGLRRYLLATEHGATHVGRFGLFDAPEPWGPWTTVAYEERWGEGHVEVSAFYWSFPAKWLSADGTQFTLAFSGKNSNDSWNTVNGRFVRQGNR